MFVRDQLSMSLSPSLIDYIDVCNAEQWKKSAQEKEEKKKKKKKKRGDYSVFRERIAYTYAMINMSVKTLHKKADETHFRLSFMH